VSLSARADALPTDPGVYLFKDRRGGVVYVGKARNLRARVRQYLSGQDTRLWVPFLVSAAQDVDVVVTKTEKEALILENTLIKKYRPRYNVKLVDDSSFLHLRIDPAGFWPRFQVVRRVSGDRARHFGPFHSASRARATLEFIQRRFPLRTCSDRELNARSRPCLMHQMGRCVAPCVGLATRPAYDEIVTQAMLFLEGRNAELVGRLRARMDDAAEALDFEEAARLRDLISAIEATVERQAVAGHKQGNRDAWALAWGPEDGVAVLIPVRQGLMEEAVVLKVRRGPAPDPEQLQSVLNQWYAEAGAIPEAVLLPFALDDDGALAEVLAERRGSRVEVTAPQRGDKARLLDIAEENAHAALARAADKADTARRALDELQRVCQLPRLPRRIECYDNSNIQGSDPVAAMVVFTDGALDRAAGRRFHVRTVVGADDFATMREILGRRIARGLAEGDLPDLIVVDGGKGQLSAVRAALVELGVADQKHLQSGLADGRPVVGLCGLVKPRTEHARGDREATDKIVLPEVQNPLRLPHNSAALRLLQALRDETHDSAVRFHRKTRSARTLHSALDRLEGVGPARRKALLHAFGSVSGVSAASVEALAALPGIGPALAARIHAALHSPSIPD